MSEFRLLFYAVGVAAVAAEAVVDGGWYVVQQNERGLRNARGKAGRTEDLR